MFHQKKKNCIWQFMIACQIMANDEVTQSHSKKFEELFILPVHLMLYMHIFTITTTMSLFHFKL